jgi:hypothetical protein
LRFACAILLLVVVAKAPAEILDRTVAVVGTQAITASEVELQLRLEQMFNNAPLDLSADARQAALQRLIEQRLIEADMTLAGLQIVEDRDVDAALEQLRQERFAGLPLADALAQYGVKERDVREFLRKQLRFTRYVQFRFRAGLQPDDEAIQTAYRKRFAGVAAAPPLAEVRDELRRQVLDERAETMLDERVRQLRAETRVALLDPIEAQTAPEVIP